MSRMRRLSARRKTMRRRPGDWHACSGWETFSGKVVYETGLSGLNDEPSAWVLDLGEVGETAVVSVNGQRLEPRLCPPYRWTLDASLLQTDNRFSVEVINTLGAHFRDGGFNRDVPSASGLLGPVTLQKLTKRMLDEK